MTCTAADQPEKCNLSSKNPWFCQSKFLGIATLFYPHESVAQAVTLPLKGQQVTMMCQAVNHSRSHLVIGKDGASLGKLQIGGNDETPALVAA